MHAKLADALTDCRKAFWSVAVFSAGVNLLMLAGPLYMLQVYDRVLVSRSVPTLVALTVFLVGAYAFQAGLDMVRARIVVRVAALLDTHLATSVHAALVRIANRSRTAGEAHQPMRDLDQIRAFLMSSGPIAIVDLPWVPVFLAVCFLIHTWLGVTALAGAIILLALTLVTERASHKPAREVAAVAGTRLSMMEADRRNSESVVAMGMGDVLAGRWTAVNSRYLSAVASASDVVASMGSLSRIVRQLLQSAILGVGAFLVIRNELSAGAMIAASIMMGRALAPIETVIGSWRGFVAARDSMRQLSAALPRTAGNPAATALPAPVGRFGAENLTVAAPEGSAAIVKGVNFRLTAGEALGIIGPNGAGKTSLTRTLTGIWPPLGGTVRIDGATLDQWDPALLGRHVGFVSQAAELFDGTVAQNIARMADAPESAAVVDAARAAGAHDLILRLPSGYDTRIGEGGATLSAGARQRIALARALYRNPFLLVLDEPGSNLDAEGEAALQRAIEGAKARGAVVILIAHRPSALAVCDKVLVLMNGAQQDYGPRDEILKRYLAPQSAAVAPAPAPALKVLRDFPKGA